MEFRFLLTLSDRIKHNQLFVTFFANSDLKLICHLIRLCKEDNANQIITTEFYFKIHYIFEGQVSYNCTIFTIVISKKEQNFLIKLFFKYKLVTCILFLTFKLLPFNSLMRLLKFRDKTRLPRYGEKNRRNSTN